jgi:serine/threonine protein kinase
VITLWYRPPEILLGQKDYDTAADIWSAACIMCEMKLGKPLIMGDCEIHQIFKIFQMFGTPSETSWPGISKLPDYKKTFPKYHPDNMKSLGSNFGNFGDLDPKFLDLVSQMLILDPKKRMNGHDILNHVFFPPSTKKIALFQRESICTNKKRRTYKSPEDYVTSVVLTRCSMLLQGSHSICPGFLGCKQCPQQNFYKE